MTILISWRNNAQRWFAGFLSLAATTVMTGSVLSLHAERNAQAQPITSLGDATWWAIVTTTTVGYGDEVPITSVGRVIAVALLLTGVALFSAITALLASKLVATTRLAHEQAANADLHRAITELSAQLHETIARVNAQTPPPEPRNSST